MNDRLWWKIVPGTRSQRDDMAGVPAGILTAGARFHHESMPQEVAMLLPTSHGPARLIDEVVENPWGCEGVMLGLFLGGPFLNVALENGRLHRSGITWIANLPSVEQQDLEFSRQLSDVGLDLDHELNSLGQFKAGGFHTAAVVADARGATAAAGVEPDAIIVMPRVVDFAAGFPSLRQRSTAAQAAAQAARLAGWSGLLLGLGEAREADNEGLWPNGLDALVCRPEVVG
ncbi:MAG: hypothetical protein U5R46_03610 [Gammaproteobacteria bacterium]|nr:hypothetical protein [Gammaproteobacteria bacterium]